MNSTFLPTIGREDPAEFSSAENRLRLDSDEVGGNGDPHLPPGLRYSHSVVARREIPSGVMVSTTDGQLGFA